MERILIASLDEDYRNKLTEVLSTKYAEQFEIHVCSSMSGFYQSQESRHYQIALLEREFIELLHSASIRMPVYLYDPNEPLPNEVSDAVKIKKYQRISRIVGEMLQSFSQMQSRSGMIDTKKGKVTAVWSVAGGVGKTTVALAYAVRKVGEGHRVIYLSFEPFSSNECYFTEPGISISSALGRSDVDLSMFLEGIRTTDRKSGIMFYGKPDNYDDLNVLSTEEIECLVEANAHSADEVVIDIPSSSDERVKKILDIADCVFIVSNGTKTGSYKWRQFVEQNSLYDSICNKLVFVANMSSEPLVDGKLKTVRLPMIESGDPNVVYKSLSSAAF